MLYPGFEPGLPRPQRGVLTTRLIEQSKLENPGFDPGASCLQSTRSSDWANPPILLWFFTGFKLSSKKRPKINFCRKWSWQLTGIPRIGQKSFFFKKKTKYYFCSKISDWSEILYKNGRKSIFFKKWTLLLAPSEIPFFFNFHFCSKNFVPGYIPKIFLQKLILLSFF